MASSTMTTVDKTASGREVRDDWLLVQQRAERCLTEWGAAGPEFC